MQPKIFNGICVQSGVFKRQRNVTCISQRKLFNQMIAKSYGIFPYKQINAWNMTDAPLLLLIRKMKDTS